MIKSFFVTAFRNFLRRKNFVLINLAGLIVGLSAFATLFLFTSFEKSYDIFPGSKRVVRIKSIHVSENGSGRESVLSPFGAGPDIKAAFPEVEDYARVVKTVALIQYQDRWTKSENVAYVDEGFFRVFSLPLLKGNIDHTLTQINTMVVSASFAKKIFGDENPVGKHINYKGRLIYEITGLFPDFPKNSHLQFDALLSFRNYEAVQPGSMQEPWQWYNPVTYLRLRPGVEPYALEEKLMTLIEEKVGESLREANTDLRFELQPVQSIHLQSNYEGELGKNGDGELILYLEYIAFAILFLALINYASLSSAKSIERSREIGIRKLLGSQRYQVIVQFMGESLIIHLIAVSLAVVVISVTQQFWPEYFLSAEQLLQLPAQKWLLLSLFFFAGVLASGLYPAVIISGYDVIKSLKGIVSGNKAGGSLRRIFVVAQFATSLVLIILINIVVKQLQMMQETPLGFNSSNRLIIRDSEVYDSLFERNSAIYKRELARLPGVQQVSYVGMLPGDHNLFYAGNVRKPSAPVDAEIPIEYVLVDEAFDATYGLQSLAGPGFSEQSVVWKEIILNESAMRAVGFNQPEDAINEYIIFSRDTARIVRILKDFHFHAPREPVKPLAFLFAPHMGYYFVLEVAPNNITSVRKAAEDTYSEIYLGQPFSYKLLDEHFNKQYSSEKLFERSLYFFTGLSVFITCLGLLGMIAYNMQVRRKEIAIRKTLGSSSAGILAQLWREHLLTVLISGVVAIPIAWYFASQWLITFASRITLAPHLFVWPLLILLVVTLATVSFQTIRAALANPVKALRSE